MLIRTAAAAALALSLSQVSASPARADDNLCKPGHVLDQSHGVCYDPATSYRPNLPQQQPVFGSGPAAAEAKPQGSAPSQSGGGIFGWLSDQARFCRFGDRQVGSGDAAYCVDRGGHSYPAGR